MFFNSFTYEIINGSEGSDNFFESVGKPILNPPNCTILDNCFFILQNTFTLADGLFPIALRILETSVSVNNNLRGKLVSSLELRINFDERFKVTSVLFSIADFNLLS